MPLIWVHKTKTTKYYFYFFPSTEWLRQSSNEMPSALYIQNKELLLKPENLYGKSRNAHFLLVLYTVWIFELRSKHNNKTHTNYLDTLRKERERDRKMCCVLIWNILLTNSKFRWSNSFELDASNIEFGRRKIASHSCFQTWIYVIRLWTHFSLIKW